MDAARVYEEIAIALVRKYGTESYNHIVLTAEECRDAGDHALRIKRLDPEYDAIEVSVEWQGDSK